MIVLQRRSLLNGIAVSRSLRILYFLGYMQVVADSLVSQLVLQWPC